MSGIIEIIDLTKDDIELLQEKKLIYHDGKRGKIEIRLVEDG